MTETETKIVEKKTKSRSLTWIFLILAIVAVAAGFAIWKWLQLRGNQAQYQTTNVTQGDIVQSVTATGQVNPVNNVQVGSQVSGIIEKIMVDFNSTVEKGEVIAQIDPATYEANVHQAEGDLANAKAGLSLVQSTLTRKKALRAQDYVSQADLDKAEADVLQAEASIKVRTAALEKAKVDLARCTIYSPIKGVVISRNVDVGQTVAASLNAPVLFVIANDLAKMQIDANVAEADIGNIQVAQNVDFTVDAFPYQTFHGKVRQIRNSPITVQNVVTYDVVIDVNNAELKLRPGMTANVSIIITRREDILKIPNAAFRFRLPESEGRNTQSSMSSSTNGVPNRTERRREGGHKRSETSSTRTVYILTAENQPKAVVIEVGVSDGISTEVVRGLSEGDRVITGKLTSQSQTSSPTASPFGGAGGGGRRRGF
jgi:HlyD family secretion protein